jgi:hypothetical protein
MITPNTPPYDPARLVSLKAITPLWANGKRMEIGEVFQVQARIAAEVLATRRADFADQADRHLVYKTVHLV